MKKTQLRGHCQCCGREQAIVNGRMAKHGYTIVNGWFSGVCSGDSYAPMQTSREQTDKIIGQVGMEVMVLKALAKDYLTGKIVPEKIFRKVGFGNKATLVEIPFATAPAWQQTDCVNRTVYDLEQRAKQGEFFIRGLTDVVNGVHGKDLRVVILEEAPARIVGGEKRLHKDGHVYTSRYQEGARVYYDLAKGGKVFQSWMGVTSWRKLESV